MQHVNLDLAAAARQAEDVAVDGLLAHDLLALDRPLDGRDLVAQARGLLEALLVRRALHPRVQLLARARPSGRAGRSVVPCTSSA